MSAQRRLLETERDSEILERLFRHRFGNPPICPTCHQAHPFYRRNRGPVYASQCIHISPCAGTVFGDSKMPLSVWAEAILWRAHYRGSIRKFGIEHNIEWRTAQFMISRASLIPPGMAAAIVGHPLPQVIIPARPQALDGEAASLVPLLLYRGRLTPDRAERLWLFAQAMMDAGIENLKAGGVMHASPDYAHLRRPDKPISAFSLRSFWLRLLDNSELTDTVPGFTEYVRQVADNTRWLSSTAPWQLRRVSLVSTDSRGVRVPWRIHEPAPKRPPGRPKPPNRFPFDDHRSLAEVA